MVCRPAEAPFTPTRACARPGPRPVEDRRACSRSGVVNAPVSAQEGTIDMAVRIGTATWSELGAPASERIVCFRRFRVQVMHKDVERARQFQDQFGREPEFEILRYGFVKEPDLCMLGQIVNPPAGE